MSSDPLSASESEAPTHPRKPQPSHSSPPVECVVPTIESSDPVEDSFAAVPAVNAPAGPLRDVPPDRQGSIGVEPNPTANPGQSGPSGSEDASDRYSRALQTADSTRMSIGPDTNTRHAPPTSATPTLIPSSGSRSTPTLIPSSGSRSTPKLIPSSGSRSTGPTGSAPTAPPTASTRDPGTTGASVTNPGTTSDLASGSKKSPMIARALTLFTAATAVLSSKSTRATVQPVNPTRPQSALPQHVPTSVPRASHGWLGEVLLPEQTLLLEGGETLRSSDRPSDQALALTPTMDRADAPPATSDLRFPLVPASTYLQTLENADLAQNAALPENALLWHAPTSVPRVDQGRLGEMPTTEQLDTEMILNAYSRLLARLQGVQADGADPSSLAILPVGICCPYNRDHFVAVPLWAGALAGCLHPNCPAAIGLFSSEDDNIRLLPCVCCLFWGLRAKAPSKLQPEGGVRAHVRCRFCGFRLPQALEHTDPRERIRSPTAWTHLSLSPASLIDAIYATEQPCNRWNDLERARPFDPELARQLTIVNQRNTRAVLTAEQSVMALDTMTSAMMLRSMQMICRATEVVLLELAAQLNHLPPERNQRTLGEDEKERLQMAQHVRGLAADYVLGNSHVVCGPNATHPYLLMLNEVPASLVLEIAQLNDQSPKVIQCVQTLRSLGLSPLADQLCGLNAEELSANIVEAELRHRAMERTEESQAYEAAEGSRDSASTNSASTARSHVTIKSGQGSFRCANPADLLDSAMQAFGPSAAREIIEAAAAHEAAAVHVQPSPTEAAPTQTSALQPREQRLLRRPERFSPKTPPEDDDEAAHDTTGNSSFTDSSGSTLHATVRQNLNQAKLTEAQIDQMVETIRAAQATRGDPRPGIEHILIEVNPLKSPGRIRKRADTIAKAAQEVADYADTTLLETTSTSTGTTIRPPSTDRQHRPWRAPTTASNLTADRPGPGHQSPTDIQIAAATVEHVSGRQRQPNATHHQGHYAPHTVDGALYGSPVGPHQVNVSDRRRTPSLAPQNGTPSSGHANLMPGRPGATPYHPLQPQWSAGSGGTPTNNRWPPQPRTASTITDVFRRSAAPSLSRRVEVVGPELNLEEQQAPWNSISALPNTGEPLMPLDDSPSNIMQSVMRQSARSVEFDERRRREQHEQQEEQLQRGIQESLAAAQQPPTLGSPPLLGHHCDVTNWQAISFIQDKRKQDYPAKAIAEMLKARYNLSSKQVRPLINWTLTSLPTSEHIWCIQGHTALAQFRDDNSHQHFLNFKMCQRCQDLFTAEASSPQPSQPPTMPPASTSGPTPERLRELVHEAVDNVRRDLAAPRAVAGREQNCSICNRIYCLEDGEHPGNSAWTCQRCVKLLLESAKQAPMDRPPAPAHTPQRKSEVIDLRSTGSRETSLTNPSPSMVDLTADLTARLEALENRNATPVHVSSRALPSRSSIFPSDSSPPAPRNDSETPAGQPPKRRADGSPPDDDGDDSDNDGKDDANKTPKMDKKRNRIESLDTALLRTHGLRRGVTERQFRNMAARHAMGSMLWRNEFTDKDAKRLKDTVARNKDILELFCGDEQTVGPGELGGNYGRGIDIYRTALFVLQICHVEDLSIPDHPRLWISQCANHSTAAVYFKDHLPNFLSMPIDEVIHWGFERFGDTHSCSTMYERQQELLLGPHSFVNLIFEAKDPPEKSVTLIAMFEKLKLILTHHHTKELNSKEMIQVFCRVMPEAMREQLKVKLNPNEVHDIFNLPIERFEQALRLVTPATQADLRRLAGGRRTAISAAPAEMSPDPLEDEYDASRYATVAAVVGHGNQRPPNVNEISGDPLTDGQELTDRELPEFVRNEIAHPEHCQICRKLKVAQMRTDREGRCPFDPSAPMDPKKGHWRVWLCLYISGIEVPGWNAEAMRASRARSSKEFAQYDRLVKNVVVQKQRKRNLAHLAEEAPTGTQRSDNLGHSSLPRDKP